MSSPFASFLRVYEPLAAFDRERQRYWRGYAKSGRAVSPVVGAARQRALILDALGAGWSGLPDEDEAYLMWREEPELSPPLICPWSLRVRVAEAALEARDGVPPQLADAFVPPALADASEAALAGWRASMTSPDAGVPRLHEQAVMWLVPIRWFVFFDGSERELNLAPERSVRFRTPISLARRRGHRALSVLRRSLPDGPVTSELAETVRWLEEFHPGSVLELDYGGLAGLMPDEKLMADKSAELAASGIAAMSEGDLDGAGSAYEQLVEFWRETQLLERCN
ncbi:hypothetical protein [Longispora albida]|uniref:hypothetical protein n=1 Tax=Longispora albida TaxID=203523 RepID=UPI000475B469|nr:hypothetical protein [Longispora albida]